MKIYRHTARTALIAIVIATLAGCATYDRRTTNTMAGAGLGAAAGAVVSGGNPVYTLGGAAAGGLLGNILTEDRDYRRGRGWDRGGGRHDWQGRRHHYR